MKRLGSLCILSLHSKIFPKLFACCFDMLCSWSLAKHIRFILQGELRFSKDCSVLFFSTFLLFSTPFPPQWVMPLEKPHKMKEQNSCYQNTKLNWKENKWSGDGKYPTRIKSKKMDLEGTSAPNSWQIYVLIFSSLYSRHLPLNDQKIRDFNFVTQCNYTIAPTCTLESGFTQKIQKSGI